MGSAVYDVHHWNRKDVSVCATDVSVKRKVEVSCCSLGYSEGYSEDGIGAEILLGVGSVECKELAVDGNLVERAHSDEFRSDDLVDIVNCLQDTLAHIALLVAVPEFEGLVLACGCS